MAKNRTSFRKTVDLSREHTRNAIVNGALPLQRGQWVALSGLHKGRFLRLSGTRIQAAFGNGSPYSMNREFDWARANGY